MDWLPYMPPYVLLAIYCAVTGAALVFAALSIHSQATICTGWTSKAAKLALFCCLAIVALYNATSHTLHYIQQMGINHFSQFLVVTRLRNALPSAPGSTFAASGLATFDWWWTEQTSMFMVGAWNVFLVTEGNRRQIKYLWAYMILAQTVSLSFASSLFCIAFVLSKKQHYDMSASPYLCASTIFSMVMLLRSFYSNDTSAMAASLCAQCLTLIPLLQPAAQRPQSSFETKWLYHTIHAILTAAYLPILVQSTLPSDAGTGLGSYVAILYGNLMESYAFQDLLCSYASFTALMIWSLPPASLRGWLSVVYLVIGGIPLLSATAAFALAAITGAEQPAAQLTTVTPASTTESVHLPAPDSSSSPRLLLKEADMWCHVTRHSLYQYLWKEGPQVYYAATEDRTLRLSDLEGTPVPDTDVYPPWRDGIREASRPPQPGTYVKYGYLFVLADLSSPGPVSDHDAGGKFEHIDAEVNILEKLSTARHPNIVEYRGCLRQNDLLVGICLRKYACSLEELVKGTCAESKRPPFNPETIIIDVKAGLEYIHSLGLVHDDINPRNIMIDNDGHGIVIDFDSCMPIGGQSRGGTPGWALNPTLALIENDAYGVDCLERFIRGEYDGDDVSPYW